MIATRIVTGGREDEQDRFATLLDRRIETVQGVARQCCSIACRQAVSAWIVASL
jgi:hypothetical protein